MEAILKVQDLSGGYSIGRPVLHDIGFEVRPGEMVGLIGLNGAGKSTTIKHILGLLQPHRGEIRVKGIQLAEDSHVYRSALAYVPESPLMYDELTVKEHLELTAMAYGLEQDEYIRRSERLIAEFQMKDKMNSFSAHLSKGMKQKMMIMNAFMVEPVLYIIDEPFLGLDPLGIRSLLDLMVSMKERGAAILMSSHILSTIERYCDKYVVLHKGRMAAAGTLDEVRNQAGLPGQPLEDVFYALVKEGSVR
ncbi:multidrug ABC transporter ATP-binding protein [Paenibacillus swuensis]|uniref:Multidrug ABC transporter ATP-binding protein n=1 Tax=Paenibacillus swuensis TaxID=1178515 RepID=A0A172TGN9_9BACL|nr:ABC transporter ATP-binding protein [Paenibacillus swuensis]ANE46132.1 multidrug ABC transporter ATP-binding protein [Paenibacillus swuensis]